MIASLEKKLAIERMLDLNLQNCIIDRIIVKSAYNY